MQTEKYVYWEDDGYFVGYFQDYPDYWTQGNSLDDLKDHLVDLYNDLTSGMSHEACTRQLFEQEETE